MEILKSYKGNFYTCLGEKVEIPSRVIQAEMFNKLAHNIKITYEDWVNNYPIIVDSIIKNNSDLTIITNSLNISISFIKKENTFLHSKIVSENDLTETLEAISINYLKVGNSYYIEKYSLPFIELNDTSYKIEPSFNLNDAVISNHKNNYKIKINNVTTEYEVLKNGTHVFEFTTPSNFHVELKNFSYLNKHYKSLSSVIYEAKEHIINNYLNLAELKNPILEVIETTFEKITYTSYKHNLLFKLLNNKEIFIYIDAPNRKIFSSLQELGATEQGYLLIAKIYKKVTVKEKVLNNYLKNTLYRKDNSKIMYGFKPLSEMESFNKIPFSSQYIPLVFDDTLTNKAIYLRSPNLIIFQQHVQDYSDIPVIIDNTIPTQTELLDQLNVENFDDIVYSYFDLNPQV